MKWRVAGINFDHFHMGDLLRMAHEHPDAEIVAICDEYPPPMVDTGSKNYLKISLEEVAAGKINYRYRV